MHLDVFLSLFSLMLLSLAVFLLARKLKVPYTVLLVIAGSLLVPISKIEFFSFITSFHLTPELLFFVFLPILIFESAYNMNIRSLTENIHSIALLAVVGLIVSTVFIGVVGFYVFRLAGFEVPLLALLLFGAIISSTDPVAVLALFKEYGAPKRLTLIFEGESLLNDATGFAAFLVVLELLVHGYSGYASITSALFSFFTMLIGGILFGLLMGFGFAKIIEWVRGNEHLEITLTLLVAHFTFILAEVISEHLVILGHSIHLSSIIATTVASLVIGNFGRYKMSPGVEEYMEKFWGYFAFVTNSLVFILMGLLFASLSISLNVAILPIALAIAVVVVGRAISIYPLLWILNLIGRGEPIPANWMHLLSWGSLRGSLAVIMVLLIPDDVTIPGWTYDFSVKQFVAAITIGSIYFTLLIKATTIGRVMNWLGIDALTEEEWVGYHKSKAAMYDEMRAKLKELVENNKITEPQYQILDQQYLALYQKACFNCKSHLRESGELLENILRIYALGVEKGKLKELFQRGEITEKIYKKILNMLSIQTDRIENGKAQVSSAQESFPTDGFEQLIAFFRRLFFSRSYFIKPEEMYLYLWALTKINAHALDQLASLSDSSFGEVFDDKTALDKLVALYQSFQENTRSRMDTLTKKHAFLLNHLNEASAEAALNSVQIETLNNLHKNEIITSKLFILLSNELDETG
ncbi:cation:proton antiporter [Methylotetracoccus oryzae]|uniref:cation:proton antiporter n=1 Tax=Methylotetracoccus oryzae TaxID=1919059 RepID=UPI001117C184|nr:sodium:proton antiporter [Methylotetracoccus oryzae]